MKQVLAVVLAVIMLASFSGVALADKPPEGLKGNGLPKQVDTLYKMNIIGVPQEKENGNFDNDSGKRIFVRLWGNTKIMLAEGDDFDIVDANGTDGTAAFTLPNPDPDNDGVTEYSVWVRVLGTPGRSANVTTCASWYDGTQWVEVCSVYSAILIRSTGKSTFKNYSKELLYIYADLDGNGNPERYPLFDDEMENYFWNYDNKGLKVAQFYFIDMSTTVP